MTAEIKEKIKRYAIPGSAALVLVAAVTALVLLLSGKKEVPEETVPQTTVITESTLPQSDYTPADFTYDGEFLICTASEYKIGIDVSHHQGDIDWTAVKAAGVEFAMVRLGYRSQSMDGELNEDRNVEKNLQGARDAGLLVGAYFYSQATSLTEAVEEARFALEILDGFPLDLPLVFDWEQEARTENVSVQTLTGASVAFCSIAEEAGYRPMIYFNSYQAQNLVDLTQLQDYPWWLAMYEVGADFPCRFDIWQYSSTGTVPGIQGNVDLNVMIVEDFAE